MVTRHGQRILPDAQINDVTSFDILLIPGGDSALEIRNRSQTLEWLRNASSQAEHVLTVCTGSILLAMTGQLDGRKATTNKQDFRDTIHFGPKVQWIEKARWVQDGKFFTSSGVSAGMDMALGFAEHLLGRQAAETMAEGVEYEWHDDPDWDPFAVKAGLLEA